MLLARMRGNIRTPMYHLYVPMKVNATCYIEEIRNKLKLPFFPLSNKIQKIDKYRLNTFMKEANKTRQR
jgi:hypothetical protein